MSKTNMKFKKIPTCNVKLKFYFVLTITLLISTGCFPASEEKINETLLLNNVVEKTLSEESSFKSELILSSSKKFPREGIIKISEGEQKKIIDDLQNIQERFMFWFDFLDGMGNYIEQSANYEITQDKQIYQYFLVEDYFTTDDIKTKALEYFSLDFVFKVFYPAFITNEVEPPLILDINNKLYARFSDVSPNYMIFEPSTIELLCAEENKAVITVQTECQYGTDATDDHKLNIMMLGSKGTLIILCRLDGNAPITSFLW